MKVYKLFLGIFVSIGLLIALSICASAEFKTTYYPEEMKIEIEASGEYFKNDKTFAAAYLNGKMLNVSPVVTDKYGDSLATVLVDEEPEYVKIFSFDVNLSPIRQAKQIAKKSFIVVENGTKTQTITAAEFDFVGYYAGEFRYEDTDGNEEKIKLTTGSALSIYYNGRLVDTANYFGSGVINALMLNAEEITFTGSSTGDYNKIFITDYSYHKVNKVYAEYLYINASGLDLELDPEVRGNINFRYTIYDADGNEIDIEDIKKDDILNIVAPLYIDPATGYATNHLANVSYMDIYVTSKTVTGAVTEDFLDGRYAINGNIYKMVSGALPSGAEGTFYITIDGRIYSYDATANIAKDFGFIVRAWSEGKYDNTVYENIIRMYTAEGEIVDFSVADRLKITGTVVTPGTYTSSALNTMVGTTIKALAADQATSALAEAALAERVVTYKLNADGEIRELEFAGDGITATSVASGKAYRDDINTFGAKKINDNSVLFIAPVTENCGDMWNDSTWNVDEDDLKIGDFDKLDDDKYGGYNAATFVFNTDARTLAAAVIAEPISTSFAGTHIAVVKSRGSVYDAEYGSLVKYTLIQSGETIALTVSPEAEGYIYSLNPGDVFRYILDDDGNIDSMQVFYYASTAAFDHNGLTESLVGIDPVHDIALVYGYIDLIEDGVMTIDVGTYVLDRLLGEGEGNTYALIDEDGNAAAIDSNDVTMLRSSAGLRATTPYNTCRVIAVLTEDGIIEDCVMITEKSDPVVVEIAPGTDYIYAKVNKVHADELYIATDRFDLELDYEVRGNKKFRYTIYDADGNEITIEDIKEDDILNIAIPEGTEGEYSVSTVEYMDIYVTSKTVTGTATEDFLDGRYVINGDVYETVSGRLPLGIECEFYTTIDGKIYAYDAKSGLPEDFGFIVRAYSEGKYDNTVFDNTIRMYTAEDEIVNLSVADELTIKGTVVPAGTYTGSALNTLVGTTIKALTADSTMYEFDVEARLDDRVVTYKLNADGEICELVFAGDGITATSVSNKTYRDDINTFGAKKIDEKSVLFIAPVTEIEYERWNVDEDDLKIGNFDKLDPDKAGGYKAATFVFDTEARTLAAAIVAEPISSSFGGTHLAVVKSRGMVYDAEYDSLVKYTLIQGGETISLTVSPEAEGTIATLNAGDVFRYTVDDNGNIDNMQVIYVASAQAFYNNDLTLSRVGIDSAHDIALVYGYIDLIEDGVMTVDEGADDNLYLFEYLLGEGEGNTYASIDEDGNAAAISSNDITLLRSSASLRYSVSTRRYRVIAALTEDEKFEDCVMIIE